MSLPSGTHLGGIKTLDDLRMRCFIDDMEQDPCWHFRTARGGKPTRNGLILKVWLYGHGSMSLTRAAWFLDRGKPVEGSLTRVVRRCTSYDCCNPKHLRLTNASRHPQLLADAGRASSAAKRAAIERIAAQRAVVAPELVRWIAESPQSGAELSRVIGISAGRINVLRRRERLRLAALAVSSPFRMGMQAGGRPWLDA